MRKRGSYSDLITALLVGGCVHSIPLGQIRTIDDRIVAETRLPGIVGGVHALSDGRVLVLTGTPRRLVLYDSTLQFPTLIADSTAATGYAIPTSVAAIVPYIGDTTLLVMPFANGVTVVGPDGRFVRKVLYAESKFTPVILNSRYDGHGGTIIAMAPRRTIRDQATIDTMSVVRTDLTSGRIDTLGRFTRGRRTFLPDSILRRLEGHSFTMVFVASDAFGLLNDGTVALVRASDYHIDWIEPNGRRRTSRPMPNVWHLLTAADKAEIIDSAVASRSITVSLTATRQSDSTVLFQSRSNLPPPVAAGTVTEGGLTFRTDLSGNIVLSTAELLPDTAPPLTTPGIAIGDADGRLWIQRPNYFVPHTTRQPGTQYDIVDRAGRIVDRVRLPSGMAIKAFRSGRVFVAISSNGFSRLIELRLK